MKFGVIGAAHGHIASFINTMLESGHEFTGVYDESEKRAKVYADKYDVPVYNSSKDLLDKGIEIAGTSAVNNKKIDIIEECFNFGVHIIADKPIVTTKAQYERLEEIIKADKIKVGMLLTLRFSGPYFQLKKIIDANELGRILSYEFFNPHNLNPDSREEWHFSDEQNGGPVIDLIIHNADLFNWYSKGQKPVSYTGVKTKSVMSEKPSFYDHASVYMQTEDGVSAYYKTGWLMPECSKAAGYNIMVTGSKATAVIEENILKICTNKKDFKEIKCPAIKGNPTSDFLKFIDGKKALIDHNDILTATKMTIDMEENIKVKKFV